jgi:hypothetical protein
VHLCAAVVRFTAAIDRLVLVSSGMAGQAGWCASFTESLDDCFVSASCFLFFAQQSSRHGTMDWSPGHLVPGLLYVLCPTGQHWGGYIAGLCVHAYVVCVCRHAGRLCAWQGPAFAALCCSARVRAAHRAHAVSQTLQLGALSHVAVQLPSYRPWSLCRQVVAGWSLQACCWSRWRFK